MEIFLNPSRLLGQTAIEFLKPLQALATLTSVSSHFLNFLPGDAPVHHVVNRADKFSTHLARHEYMPAKDSAAVKWFKKRTDACLASSKLKTLQH